MTAVRHEYPYYAVDEYEDFPSFLKGIVERHADQPAITSYDAQENSYTYTYRQLTDDTRALARAFQQNGLAGRHVAIIGENSYLWLVTFLAIVLSGGIAVSVDIEQPDDEIWEMARRADADIAICSETFYSLYKRSNAPIAQVFSLKQIQEMIDKELILQSNVPEIQINADTPALIVYTSGTTSTSKPILLTHGNLMYNACRSHMLIKAGKRIFAPLPFYHTYGLNACVLNMLAQGRHVGINGNLKTIMRDIRLFEPDMIMAVPLIVENMNHMICAEMKRRGVSAPKRTLASRLFSRKYPDVTNIITDLFGRNLSSIICGGAYLDEQIALAMETYGIKVLQGYGITECSPLISVNRNLDAKLDSVGKILPGLSIKFVDDEIWVKGPSVAQGYYRDELLTKETFEDGWFKTGDIGYLDQDGHLFITGRKKNLIVFKSGKKVAPEEIERLVTNIPLVKEAIAFGSSNGPSADDVVLALMVYPDPEATRGMSSYEILEQIQMRIHKINRGLPAYKRIQLIKLSETAFERNALHKIKRHGI